jgi:hypothetical protein
LCGAFAYCHLCLQINFLNNFTVPIPAAHGPYASQNKPLIRGTLSFSSLSHTHTHIRVKGKLHPATGHDGLEGGVDEELYSFFLSQT